MAFSFHALPLTWRAWLHRMRPKLIALVAHLRQRPLGYWRKLVPPAIPLDTLVTALNQQLRPDEQLLWQARPLTWSAVAGQHRELPWLAGGLVLCCSMALVFGAALPTILTIGMLLAGIAAATWMVYQGHQRYCAARQTLYALSSQRLLRLRLGAANTDLLAQELQQCSNPRVISHSGGTGDIVIPSRKGPQHPPFIMIAIPDALELGHRITAARRQ